MCGIQINEEGIVIRNATVHDTAHIPTFAYLLFFIISLLTDPKRLKFFIFKRDIAFFTSNLNILILQKYQPLFLIYNSRQHKQ